MVQCNMPGLGPRRRSSEDGTMASKAKKSTSSTELTIESAEAPAWGAMPPLFPTMSMEELTDLSRENIAAVTKANQAFSEGMQAISQEWMAYTRAAMEKAGQMATALLAAKTLDEVIQLNTEAAKANLETMLARSAKLSEMGVSVANEALAPLGGRVEATFAKFTKPLAA
jgi:phasin family protein